MKKRFYIPTLAFVVVSAVFAGCVAAAQPAGGLSSVQAKEQPSGDGISMQPVSQFGYGLLTQHLGEENPVLSPVSAYVALGMVASGAKGETEKEFEKVLGAGMDAISKSLMEALPQDTEGTQLTIANSAWLDTTFTAKKKWLAAAKKQFHADVFQAPLATRDTKDAVNQWVSGRTNQLIPKLLAKKLDKGTKLALLNALYFHADWQQQFQAGATGKGEFCLEDGTAKQADMMHATMYGCGYFKDQASEGIVLPYADSNFAFVAVKPAGAGSIRDWYNAHTPKQLAAFIKGRETKTVQLTLPKFTARSRLDLKKSLQAIGLSRAFDAKKADLTLLGKPTDGENLYLGFVLQEAVVSVAEEGTQAAAATLGGVMATSAALDEPLAVTFDRPFFYMVMDMDSAVPVFMGIVDQPEK